MAYPSKFQKLVEERGKSLEEILVEELNAVGGNIAECSKRIDIGYDKLFAKIKDLELVRNPPHWSLPEVKHADPV